VLFGCQVPSVAQIVSDIKLHKGDAHGIARRLARLNWWRYIRMVTSGPP
jgi:hypothetical protein